MFLFYVWNSFIALLNNNYKPDIVWPDGDFGPDVYSKSHELLAWLCNDRYDSLVYLSSDTVQQ
jgi:hypothetical protein